MTFDVIEVALIAIYLVKGYVDAEKKASGKSLLFGGGQIEMMAEIVSLAEIQEQWFLDRGHADTGCPGMYAYEFAELMGAWLYEFDGLLTNDKYVAELDRRWAEWTK